MIWDSVVWKKELNKELKRFEKNISLLSIDEEILGFRIEKFYFLYNGLGKSDQF